MALWTCLCALSAAAGAQEELIQANFRHKTDSLGFRWDVDERGRVNDGTNNCFDGGLVLQVNGGDFYSRKSLMTPDGRELVLSSDMGNIYVTRRVLVHVDRACTRYIETFFNKGGTTELVSVSLNSYMGGSSRQALTSSGEIFAGTLSKRDVGATVLGQGSQPSAIFVFTHAKAKIKPLVSIQNGRLFQFSFNLSVPAGDSVSLLHVIAQRNGVSPDSLKDMMKELYRGRLVDPEIPEGLLSTVANFNLSGGGGVAGPLLQDVLDLAADSGVDREKKDQLLLDEYESVAGSIDCKGLKIITRHGEISVPFDEVALLAGTGLGQESTRVYLRNGEILAGTPSAEKLKFSSNAGLDIDVDPQQMHLLFTRASKDDGVASAKTAFLLETLHGDRLAMPSQSGITLDVATPWGQRDLPFEVIQQLTRIRDPFPCHLLRMKDGSFFTIFLPGKELEIDTLRFGKIQVNPSVIENLARIQVDEEDAPDAGDEDLAVPHFLLAGDSILAGCLDGPALRFATPFAVSTLKSEMIRSFERDEALGDGATPVFSIELKNGETMTGSFEEPILTLRAEGLSWQIPANHIVAFRSPPREEGDAKDEDTEREEP